MSENKQGTADTVDTNLAQAVLEPFPLPEQLRAMRWQIERRLEMLSGEITQSWLIFDRTMGAAWVASLLKAEMIVRASMYVPPPEESIDG